MIKLKTDTLAQLVVKAFVVLWLAMSASPVLAQPGADKRPNIVFIVADDQGPWTIGAQGYVNAVTPSIDRMAKQGVIVRNAYANAAVCSPARAALLTGRYATECGMTNIISEHEPGPPPDMATWPAELKNAGYRTALVGKWHLGHANDMYLPTNRGYDAFAGYPIGGKHSRDPRVLVEGEWKRFESEYTSDVLADLAMDYIREYKDGPFLISLHFWAPHANQGVPKGFKLPYRDRTWLPLKEEDLAPWAERDVTLPEPDFPNLDTVRVDRMTREYHASVHSNDRNVGRVLDLLDQLGLADNTVVIYTSDHGYLMGHHGLWHKGAGWWLTRDRRDPEGVYTDLIENKQHPVRHNLFEESIRVPCVIRWPGHIPAGTTTERTFEQVDWFPTVLAMAGVPVPDGINLRGHNYLPVLRGEDMAWRDELFAQHANMRSFARDGWKLVRDFEELGRDELFNLQSDPSEQRNLIASTDPQVSTVRDELDQRLSEQMHDIEDPLAPLAQRLPLADVYTTEKNIAN